MTDISKILVNELNATTYGLRRHVSDLQQDIAKLQEIVNGSDENQYQFDVWTQGGAAQIVAKIASLLSRQRTLQEAIYLLNKEVK